MYFSWVGGLLRHGCHDDLEHTDLFAHPSEADSEKLHRKFNKYVQTLGSVHNFYLVALHVCYAGIGDRN